MAENDMVEKVAMFIWRARERRMGVGRSTRMEPDDFDRASGAWASVMDDARAAVEAMREPSAGAAPSART